MNTKTEIPLCPMCGRPIRKNINHSTWAVVGSSVNAYDRKVPWNYRWDGMCESCGYNHNIYIREIIRTISWGDRIRMITVKAASHQVMTFIDAATILSGVEIERFSEEGENEKVFISTNELKQLIDALKGSPLLEQLDWNEDYT